MAYTNTFNTKNSPSVAYFSLEIGLFDDMKEYAGGLGILAGDTLKTAADMGLNMVGLCILYKKGYFKQIIDQNGIQQEVADEWDYYKYLTDTGKTIELYLNQEVIHAAILKYEYTGINGLSVPVYFLDTDIEQNSQENRYISYNLYTPYEATRFKQELLLGIGGVYALEALGYEIFDNYHLNESHAAFSIVALLEKLKSKAEVKKRLVFTTHTPVEHGHKAYSVDQLTQVLLPNHFELIQDEVENNALFLTKFALRNSKYANGVSKRHGSVSQKMFPDFKIDYITNGIHVGTWAAGSTKALFDKYIPKWLASPQLLKEAYKISTDEILSTHLENKQNLLSTVKILTGKELDPRIFTIGFGRRVDGYKRSGLLFKDLDRLQRIADKFNGLQVVLSGKAYFDYGPAEKNIANIVEFARKDYGKLEIVFLEDYGMYISKMMVSGSDLWLNNPIKPLEASGTSGMKASLNAVPNFSTVDGWWVEGLDEGVTGWSIGSLDSTENNEEFELEDLYNKLENVILPMYQNHKNEWAKLMKQAIVQNASYFNTHRMLAEYLEKGYLK